MGEIERSPVVNEVYMKLIVPALIGVALMRIYVAAASILLVGTRHAALIGLQQLTLPSVYPLGLPASIAGHAESSGMFCVGPP